MANKFARTVGGNWSTDASWSTTSGGAADTTKPVNGDAAILDGNSGQITVDVASACTSIVCTGYTNTLTFTNSLTCAGTVTFVAGMTIAGTGDLINTATSTMTSGGKVLTGGLQLRGTATFTLSGGWDVTGLVQLGGTTLTTGISSSTLACRSGLSILGTSSDIIGSTVVSLTGTGTVQTTQTSGTYRLSTIVNAGAGTVTFSGTLTYQAGTLTYTSGTVVVTGFILLIPATTTLNTNGISWENITFGAAAGAATITLNSLLTVTGTITLANGAVTFAGTAGFTTANLTNNSLSVTRIYTFVANNTYTITTSWINFIAGTGAVRMTIKSSSAGTKANIIFQGSSQSLRFADPTDINSNGGVPIYTYQGVITTTFNWFNTLPMGTVGYGFA